MIGPRVGLSVGPVVGPAVGIGTDELGGSFFNIGAPNEGWVIWQQSQAVGPGTGAGQAAIQAGINAAYSAVQISRYSANNITTPVSFVAEGPEDLQPATAFVGVNFPVDHAGIELKLGRLLDARHANKIRIIIVAINGSGLEDQWVNPAFDTPSLWTQFITRLDAQLLAMNAHLEGIVCLGGESDSGQSPDQNDYQTNLNEAVVNRLRARYGPAYCVVPQLSYHSGAGGSIDVVINRMYQFAAVTSRCAVVNTNAMTLQVDTVHYNDAGLINVGAAVDAMYGQLLASTWPPTNRAYLKVPGVPNFGTSATGVTCSAPTRSVGDLLAFLYTGNGNTAIATPTGYTQVANSPQHDAASASNARLHVYTRVATGDANDDVTTADVGGDGGKQGVIINLGRSVGGILTTAGSTAAANTAVTFPTVDTTGTNNCLIVNIGAFIINSNVAQSVIASWANASLTNLQQEYDRFSTTSSAGCIVVGGLKAVGGAVSGTTMTNAAAGTAGMALMTIAVAP